MKWGNPTAVHRFIDRLKREGLCMHGFELRVDSVVKAKGYWWPFREGEIHRMYSVSKSVVSLAVGILTGQGKISLDEKITDCFPEFVTPETDARLKRLTIRDMLRMATCHRKTTYREGVDEQWARTFFEVTPTHEPGVMFNYDTSCSQVLAALVEKRAGQPLLTFLQTQLFAPLGFEDEVRWLTDPSGTPQGGTGLMMSLRDLGKLAQCVLKGGRGLIPENYLRQALSCQITTEDRDAPEERYGYGYQFWMTRHGWAMYGMGGQMAIGCPEERVLLTTIADTRLQGGVQKLYDAFFEEIMAHPQKDDASLVEKSCQKLCEQALCALKFPSVPHEGGEWPLTEGVYRIVGESALQKVAFSPNAVRFFWQDGLEDTFRWGEMGQCVTGFWADGEPTLTSAGVMKGGGLHLRVHRIGNAPCGVELFFYPRGETISIRMKRSSDPATNRYDGVVYGERLK